MPLVAVGVALDGGQKDAQRHLVAVGAVQRVASVLGPARLAVIAAQHCAAAVRVRRSGRLLSHTLQPKKGRVQFETDLIICIYSEYIQILICLCFNLIRFSPVLATYQARRVLLCRLLYFFFLPHSLRASRRGDAPSATLVAVTMGSPKGTWALYLDLHMYL